MSGQTLTDRIAAAQYQLTGSDVARAVCKATTHEVMAPKKKHLDCEWTFSVALLLHYRLLVWTEICLVTYRSAFTVRAERLALSISAPRH